MKSNILKEFLKLRKQQISSNFNSLNAKQLEAVLATEGPLLVLAGAGSGKTTVLINRIANLIKYGCASDVDEVSYEITDEVINELKTKGERSDDYCTFCPVKPWKILAITFTNKAASELKYRLSERLGDLANDIWACTFHSACVKILRKDAELLGFQKDFTIYDSNDSVSLIKVIESDLNYDIKELNPKNICFEISNLKNQQISADDYMDIALKSCDSRKIITAKIYNEYSKRMFSANAMDFDDLLFFTVKLLSDFPSARDYWQNRFSYILIDEYQDTNHLQYLFAFLLSEKNKNLCVVGDDDQSIYKFRGANIENILSFETQFYNCRTIKLEQNYRSSGHILAAANSVIRNNFSRKGKELWTSNSDGDLVNEYLADDERDEADYVASKIMRNFNQGDRWSDNAILYRMNAQSNQFEYSLKRRGIPYKIYGGLRFFDRAEIKDVLSYLSVISNPNDNLRLLRIINKPARGIGNKTVESVSSISLKESCSLYQVISCADKYPELTRSCEKLKEFHKLLTYLINFAENNTSEDIFDELMEKTGFLNNFMKDNSPENMSKIENVKELKTSIINYVKESSDNSLSGYLSDIALYTDLDSYAETDDSVVLMTVHSSKGLEFKNVFIVGLDETIFPGVRSIGNIEEMEEERRLCYVAITRAQKELDLVSAKQRTIFGRTVSNSPSRFIEEISPEDIKKINTSRYANNASSLNQHKIFNTSKIVPEIFIQPHNTTISQNNIQYQIGDEIVHRAFGEGIIISMKPMGGDYLIEISFKDKGIKKLMLKAASIYMKKG